MTNTFFFFLNFYLFIIIFVTMTNILLTIGHIVASWSIDLQPGGQRFLAAGYKCQIKVKNVFLEPKREEL